MKNKTEDKPVIIAKGKLVASGRPFQYILHNGKKKFLWGDNCIKLALLLCVTLTSCSDFIDDDYSLIPSEAMPHVKEFFKLANERGHNINYSTLKIYYRNLNGLAGQSENNFHTIYFDTTSTSWVVSRESLIFHELAHSYLMRGHDDSTTDDGYSKSIMKSYIISYGPEMRQYYIDELFMLRKQ